MAKKEIPNNNKIIPKITPTNMVEDVIGWRIVCHKYKTRKSISDSVLEKRTF